VKEEEEEEEKGKEEREGASRGSVGRRCYIGDVAAASH
jgi:hypothetical protein